MPVTLFTKPLASGIGSISCCCSSGRSILFILRLDVWGLDLGKCSENNLYLWWSECLPYLLKSNVSITWTVAYSYWYSTLVSYVSSYRYKTSFSLPGSRFYFYFLHLIWNVKRVRTTVFVRRIRDVTRVRWLEELVATGPWSKMADHRRWSHTDVYLYGMSTLQINISHGRRGDNSFHSTLC